MAAMINTFGYEDERGTQRINISTIRSLYRDTQLPSAQVLMSRPPTGVLDHVRTMKIMLAQLARSSRYQTPRVVRTI